MSDNTLILRLETSQLDWLDSLVTDHLADNQDVITEGDEKIAHELLGIFDDAKNPASV